MQKGRGFCSCDTYIIIMVFILVFMGQPSFFSYLQCSTSGYKNTTGILKIGILKSPFYLRVTWHHLFQS